MPSRPRRAWLALLGLCAAGCGPSRSGSSTPPAPASGVPTSGAPVPASAEPAAEDREMIAIKGFAGQLCALTRDGALYCWGNVMVPGEPRQGETPRPLRLPGVPPLAGFEMVYDGIVGWDRDGNAVVITDDIGKAWAVHQGVFFTEMTSPGSWSRKLRRVRVRAASIRCLLTTEGRLLCNGSAHPGTRYRDQFPGEYVALGTGRFACAVDAEGRAVAVNASEYEGSLPWGKSMAPYEIRPIPGLPRNPESLACDYGALGGGKEIRAYACAVDREQRLTCTDPALEAALERAAEGVPIRSVFAARHFCIQRDDGQARCVDTHYFPDPAMLPSLVGLDASRGLALTSRAICALGDDGLPRCWGEQRVPQLGVGSTTQLEAPVHVEGFDGALEVSHSGGITCVRHSPERVRCFGRFGGSMVVEPRELRLPEPVDRIEGGAPLCVRGAKSHRWYCRDPFRSFFEGSLPDHFAPLVDHKGRKLGKNVASLALDHGRGILVLLTDGRTGKFSYSGSRKPLRVNLARSQAGPMRQVAYQGGIRTDGRGEFWLDSGPFLTRGPVRAIAQVGGRPCFLDDAHQLSCFDAKLERAAVIAKDVVALEPHGGALTTGGDALALELVDGTVQARKREGLPAMAQLAKPCGRSVDGEIWCWGTVEHLPGPPYQLEPRAVEFEP